ncbi:cyclic nucleotide-binding domain-containing protein [Streptomyces sp. NPDC002265]|uniref:cyclic nucleotide-binding domain-containing protein n=1 Tax=Streptomyces sp. NPDC002265 TaxID=3154415 RepID=UPI00332DB084
MTPHPGGSSGEEVLAALTAEQRGKLMTLARDLTLPGGTRIFEEGENADRFWVIRSGTVALDIHVPGRGRVVLETIGAGSLLGWSWLCPPRQWHLAAETREPVRAWEFDAAAVHELCAEDTALGLSLVTGVAGTIGDRLRATRTRLLDLYGPPGPQGSGVGP